MPNVTNFGSFDTPDVFVREAEPQPAIKGTGTGVVGVLVQSIRGEVGVPTLVGSLSEFVRKFGGYDATIPEGFMFVRNIFNQGASSVKVVRVTDGTHAAATGAVSGTTFRVTTPGSWGNSVTLTVSANSASGFVDLSFKYGAAEIYSYDGVTFSDATSEHYYRTVIEKSGHNFVEVTVAGSTNPTTGVITTFAGGTNGTTSGSGLADAAYVGTNTSGGLTGLVAFEADDEVNFICTPRNTSTVNTALVAHTAVTGISPRMVILAPAQGTTVASLVTSMSTINTDAAIMTYPWVQISNPYNGRKEYHSPVAFYAGVLSKLSYEVSPSRQQLVDVIGTERPLTPTETDTLSRNRISPISLLRNFGFVIRNGYNCSSIPSRQNTTRRRAVNYFTKVFETGSQQFVSKNHTDELRRAVVQAFASLLDTEVSLNKIGGPNGGKPYKIKCDADNNPPESIQQNRMNVDLQISLLAPADFIFITVDASEAKVIAG